MNCIMYSVLHLTGQLTGPAWFETNLPLRYILGDSACALIPCPNPHSERQCLDDPNKTLYTIRQSGTRVEMTETIYSFYKRRTPIVMFVRLNLKITLKVATACAILHISLDWDDEVPVDPHPGLQPDSIPRPAQEIDRLQFRSIYPPPPPHAGER